MTEEEFEEKWKEFAAEMWGCTFSYVALIASQDFPKEWHGTLALRLLEKMNG